MTDHESTKHMTIEDIERASAAAHDILRRRIQQIEDTKASQPERLAKARAEADEARGWSLIEEPWDDQWGAVPGYTADGAISAMMAVPNSTAKELFGTRLLFDTLDCGDDDDAIDAVITRYFAMVHGDPGMAFLLFSSALRTCANLVVPQMLDELEQSASNYDVRVMLAEARAKAWNGRVNELRATDEELRDMGVKGVDGYDIAAAIDLDGDEGPAGGDL